MNKLRGTLQGRRRQGAGLRRPPQGDAAGHRRPDRRQGHLRGSRLQARERRRSPTSAAPSGSSIDKDNTTIVDGDGKTDEIKGRIKRDQAPRSRRRTRDYDREKLQERLAKLAGGVAVINVGAATETEMKEKKARVEDALHATRAAVEEGIVPGGGVALIRAQRALKDLKLDDARREDRRRDRPPRLEEPIRMIVQNAGGEGSIVVAKVRGVEGRRTSATTRRPTRTRTWSRPASSTRPRSPARRCRTPRRSRACCSRPKRDRREEGRRSRAAGGGPPAAAWAGCTSKTATDECYLLPANRRSGRR